MSRPAALGCGRAGVSRARATHSRRHADDRPSLVDLTQALFEARDAHTDVFRLIDRRIGLDRLRDDLDRAERILRPHDTGHLDILLESAGVAGRKRLASVLAGVEFKRSGVDEAELLAALDIRVLKSPWSGRRRACRSPRRSSRPTSTRSVS